MSVGQPERATQDRVVTLFRGELGYRYLGDWSNRDGNSNIEEGLLSAYLSRVGYAAAQISVATHKLRTEADHHDRSLYGNNQAVYSLLRYGVPAKVEAGKITETVHLINWRQPDQNDFAIAEEVTLHGNHERRPDLVLYINGIAIGTLELKNSRVTIGDGICQSLSNQQPEFNAWFYSTVQIIFAGNDSEGLQYGTIGTPAKMFLTWKEDEEDNAGYKLDKYLQKLCEKKRLLELLYDFVLFDGGVKKLPRVHQYFGIKAAQEHLRRRKGGIIWHTQGSGKSIVMVLLAKWVLESNPHARVAIITDRDELDKQIERVFREAGEPIKRTDSGRDLIRQLSQPAPRLLCSLVHKFGKRGKKQTEAEFAQFIKDLESQPCQTSGEVFVFVDECHRTESGRLHKTMKAVLRNAVFIGFTGTPLLKQDKQTSLEVFGDYIHTYKFSEAVDDEVVLDLVYEARDIDQRLGAEDKIDVWFEAKTKGLNDWQKDELKAKWGTMQKLLSSKSRMDRVVTDIIFDFSTKRRLNDDRGNAILVASSIYEACKYFTLFEETVFKGKCAVVTSYNPQTQDVTEEETGANTETDKQFIYNVYTRIVKEVTPKPGMTAAETYEDSAKQLFIDEPATMKLLVVVDKLLTGFDAPHCTYLYIDKSMRDHGLFQAICRTNRLDGDDKDFGYIVDYKDLFKNVESAIKVYTSELDHGDGQADPEILMQSRLEKGKERLDNALEALSLLCEPVEAPKGELEHIHYFCGNSEIPTDLQQREPTSATSRAFFQWLGRTTSHEILYHLRHILRHFRHPCSVTLWSSYDRSTPCIPVDEGHRVSLMSIEEACRADGRVYVDDFPELSLVIRRTNSKLAFVIQCLRNGDLSIAEQIRAYGIKRLSHRAGEPILVDASNLDEGNEDLRRYLHHLQSSEFARELPGRLSQWDIPPSHLRDDWRTRLSRLQRVVACNDLMVTFRVANQDHTVPMHSQFDPMSETLYVVASEAKRTTTFFDAVAAHIFKIDAPKMAKAAFERAALMDLPEWNRLPSGYEDSSEDQASPNVPDQGTESSIGEAQTTHGNSAARAVKRISKPVELLLRQRQNDSNRAQPNPKPISNVRARLRSSTEEQHRHALKTIYAWHCQVCLATRSPQELAPEGSYVYFDENRRCLIEAHHPDQVHAGGSRDGGNLLIVCQRHHQQIGDAASKSHITETLRTATNLREIRFQSPGTAELKLEGVVVDVSTVDGEIPIFFATKHREIWILNDER